MASASTAPSLLLLTILTFATAPSPAQSAVTWSRNIIIYHNSTRTQTQWQQHLLRINPAGGFAPQWLFDSAILTTSQVNGKDPFTGAGFTSTDCQDLISILVSDVTALNSAIGAAKLVLARSTQFQVYVSVPYFNIYNNGFTMPNGTNINLWDPDKRKAAAHWYVDQLRAGFSNAAAAYPNLIVTGVYYHHEDVIDQDVGFVQDLNAYVHTNTGSTTILQSVFVPYYDAPNVWYSAGLGFDAVIVQPRYAFLASIDGSILHGDRLYSTGTKGVAHGVGMEYELRSSGQSQVEYWMAHQYLAIAQATGANNLPQAFFVGPFPDIFDTTLNQTQAPGSYTWSAYTDLADYLKGLPIWNYEAWIPPPADYTTNVRQTVWTNTYAGLASIRLDFNDPDPGNIWRGRVVVLISGVPVSYAARAGVEQPGILPSYQSVFVPLASENIGIGVPITIQIVRETTSPFPNVLLLAGAPYEPKYIVSPIMGQASSSSNTRATDPQYSNYLDSVPTHLGYASGKLTDGRISTPGSFDAVVAFSWIERRWTVTMDLGSVNSVSRIVIQTSRDQYGGVNWPNSTVAYLSASCEPAERGGSCPPEYATGAPSLAYTNNGARYDGNITLNFASGAQGRYVAVSGVSYGLTILHEISVYGATLLSLGKPYRVTPKPGNYISPPDWADNSLLLTDGAVFGDWIYGQDQTVGVNDGGSVQTTFSQPRTGFTYAVIWVSRNSTVFGIGKPSSVTMTWMDVSGAWQPGAGGVTNVAVLECAGGLSPCAKLPLPTGVGVYGVKGVFGGASSNWYMVSEISLGN